MTLPRALRSLTRSREKAAFYRMLHLQVKAGLRWDQLGSPGESVPFETALLKLGDEAGKLQETTQLLAEYFAAEYRAVQQVLRHATYPMFTALAATFIAPLPLVFAGRTSPYCVTVGGGLVLWALAGGSLLMAVVHGFLRRPKYVRGRLLRALAFGVESGLPLGKAVALAVEAADDDGIRQHVGRIGASRISSQPLAETFRGCPLFDAPMIAALVVAGESGDYSGSLRRLAELYES
jgi:type II secretory pathway component PulF